MIPRRHLLGFVGCALAPLPAGDPVATVGALFEGTPAGIGRRHLAAHGDHAGEATAMARDLVDAARERRQSLRTLVSQRIRDDFAAGRIVLVDGWVLSVTEARGCACGVLAG